MIVIIGFNYSSDEVQNKKISHDDEYHDCRQNTEGHITEEACSPLFPDRSRPLDIQILCLIETASDSSAIYGNRKYRSATHAGKEKACLSCNSRRAVQRVETAPLNWGVSWNLT